MMLVARMANTLCDEMAAPLRQQARVVTWCTRDETGKSGAMPALPPQL
jgi:hypothetical protein